MEKALSEIANGIRRKKGEEPLADIGAGTRLRADFGFDSFDLAELTVRVEEKFGADVFERGNIETFGELCERVARAKKS
ncbi:MAG: acyl carrier protein [Opitutales bacterium]|nr:acyl carrier protein [Opitutales bacterium]